MKGVPDFGAMIARAIEHKIGKDFKRVAVHVEFNIKRIKVGEVDSFEFDLPEFKVKKIKSEKVICKSQSEMKRLKVQRPDLDLELAREAMKEVERGETVSLEDLKKDL